MTTLHEILADAAKRKNLIADCVVVIDEEVHSKGGLSGMAIKGAYKLVKGVKPGFVEQSVDSLLNDFATQLQPIADQATTEGKPIAAYFVSQRTRVADALLSITDKRAERSSHKTVKGTYLKLRPSAKKHVEEAVPRLGKLIEKYAGG